MRKLLSVMISADWMPAGNLTSNLRTHSALKETARKVVSSGSATGLIGAVRTNPGAKKVTLSRNRREPGPCAGLFNGSALPVERGDAWVLSERGAIGASA